MVLVSKSRLGTYQCLVSARLNRDLSWSPFGRVLQCLSLGAELLVLVLEGLVHIPDLKMGVTEQKSAKDYASFFRRDWISIAALLHYFAKATMVGKLALIYIFCRVVCSKNVKTADAVSGGSRGAVWVANQPHPCLYFPFFDHFLPLSSVFPSFPAIGLL